MNLSEDIERPLRSGVENFMQRRDLEKDYLGLRASDLLELAH